MAQMGNCLGKSKEQIGTGPGLTKGFAPTHLKALSAAVVWQQCLFAFLCDEAVNPMSKEMQWPFVFFGIHIFFVLFVLVLLKQRTTEYWSRQ